MADQQAVPLIATHINDKAIINLKGLKNINNGLFFFKDVVS